MTFLTTDELAARWKMQRTTLSNWRHAGTGPAWMKLGTGRNARVLYRVVDIEAYERAGLYGTATQMPSD